MTNAMKKLEVVLKLMPDNGNLIRELINQHVAEVIGEDEETGQPRGRNVIGYGNVIDVQIEHLVRNILRKYQRTRAGL